jgi:hypothetical protein
MDLARELKVAGLPWRPQRGDLAMDRLNVPYLVVADGTDESGGVQIDTGHAVERRPLLSLTWLPRLDHLLAFLARYGPVEVAVGRAGGGRAGYHWRVAIDDGTGGARRVFEAGDGADAAGQALYYLLAQAGWRPGPPLAGA